MNILILISSLNYGGAEKQAVLDANMLCEEHNVCLVTFYGGPLEKQVSPKASLLRLRKSNYITTALNLINIVRKYNIQIIHAHLFASSVIAALSGLFCKVKVIWHFHGHRYEDEQNGNKTLTWLSWLPHIRKLLFVNTELIGYFNQKGYRFPVAKSMLMYNSSQLHVTSKTNEKNSTFSIGYIGRIVELKRVEYLVELAAWLKLKELTNFCIEIVGDGPLLPNLKELSLQLSVDDKINFRGFQTDTAAYYSSFDLFILPSREECLSLALIDAGVCGIPAIAFKVGGNDEIIKQGETGYIILTKEELFDKTLYLYNNPDERIRMGIAASSFCNATFGETPHMNELNVLYKSI
jgi:L-malate glycosyltransferase